MDNIERNQIQKSLTNGNLNTIEFSAAQIFQTGILINNARTSQGWNVLTPEETKPAARVWLYQIDRHGLPTALYQECLNRAVDRRIFHIAKREQAPALSVELLLAMFREYVTEKTEEFHEFSKPYNKATGYLVMARAAAHDPILTGKLRAVVSEYYGVEIAASDLIDFLLAEEVKEMQIKRQFWIDAHLPDALKQ